MSAPKPLTRLHRKLLLKRGWIPLEVTLNGWRPDHGPGGRDMRPEKRSRCLGERRMTLALDGHELNLDGPKADQ